MMTSLGSASATTRVEKATSHLLNGPDWALNLDICDMINSNSWHTKEVAKAIKKRLQNKHAKVQFFSLLLLETMMKNCGDPVRYEVAHLELLQEMIKIVKKQTDSQVRDKALMLLDSWQEAFGGPGSQYPHYYWAYIELKRSGVQFPRRAPEAPLTFTNNNNELSSPRFNNNNNNNGLLNSNNNYRATNERESAPPEISNMSMTELNKIKNVLELLSEMIRAVNPRDQVAIKDEIIADLVSQCRANQKKIVELVSSTGDEALLAEALALNDHLQSVLEKHDAIASGNVPLQIEPSPSVVTPPPVAPVAPVVLAPPVVEETKKPEVTVEEEDDEFAELARRKSKGKNIEQEASGSSEESSSNANNALVVLDQPLPATSSKPQDMVDFLTLALYEPNPSESTPVTSPSVSVDPNASLALVPVTTASPSSPQAYNAPQQPYNYNPYNPGYNYNPYNGYVASWANPAQPAPPQPQYYNNNNINNNYASNNPYNNPAYPTAQSYQPMERYNSFGTTTTPTPVVNNNPVPSANPPASISHKMEGMGSFGGFTGGFNNINNINNAPALKKEMPNAPKPYYMPDTLFGDLIDVKSFGNASNNNNKGAGGSGSGSGSGSGRPMINGKK